jgi:hypothetical protein
MANKFRALAEGDSWFNLPDFPIGLPIVGGSDTDLVRELKKRGHRIDSIAHFGDTLTDIAAAEDYITALKETSYDVFLLCGSGNDLLGGGDLWRYMRIYSPDRKPKAYLKPSFYSKIRLMEHLYGQIIEEALDHSKNRKLKIISHGYDYAIPQRRGYWIGRPMKRQGINKKQGSDIVEVMIDQLHSMMRRVRRRYSGHFDYVDFRGTVGKRWHDELHPRKRAFRDLAKKMDRKVQQVL